MTPKPIERIYVLTCAGDVHLTRLCVASIRYWYPDIPVTLVRDEEKGPFDTSRLERTWNLSRFESPVRRFGWGLSRLELLFLPERSRYLVLDSDIVLLGPVLDRLDRIPGDFVVHPDEKSEADLERVTFSRTRLKTLDPDFVAPRFVFNAGQYVGTSALLRREDFDPVVAWSEPRTLRHPDIFIGGDQGIFNYILAKAEAAGRVTVAREPFFLWRKHDSSAITVEGIAARSTPPLLMHWAGYKRTDIRFMERADILAFYTAFAKSRATPLERCIEALWQAPARVGECVRRWTAYVCTGLVDGGMIGKVEADRLRHFYDFEQSGEIGWCWTEPAAAIDLAVPRGDYRVRIETGSPQPMTNLSDTNLRFFINGTEVPPSRVRINHGVAEVDLAAEDLRPNKPQVLSWTLDRLSAPNDERHLAMPVTAICVFRRSRSRN